MPKDPVCAMEVDPEKAAGKSVKEKALPKSPFPPWLAIFIDNPARRLLINREKYLREIGVKEEDYVLEVGCGSGFFTTVLSDIVVETGRIYAQDVENAMLRKLEKKLGKLRYQNVIPLLCNSSAMELPDSSCDVVFCANVIEEIYKEGELEGTVREIDRVLKGGGSLAIKEHRFGGTREIIRKAEDLFVSLGYKKVFNEKTFLSYNVTLKR